MIAPMKLHLFVLFFLLLNSVTVSAWGHLLEVNSVKINLLIPTIVWYAITSRDGAQGLLVIAITGFLYDLVSSNNIGTYILAMSVTYLLIRYVVAHASMEFWWQRLLLVVMISFIFQAALRTATGYIETVWPWGAFQAVADGLVSLGLFPIFHGLVPLLEQRDANE